jgi:Yip1 domain
MSVFQRVRNICIRPSAEWGVIADEELRRGRSSLGYVLPLVASLAFILALFQATFRQISTSLGLPNLRLIFALFITSVVNVFALSLIINMLVPVFGGEKNSARALKVAMYSYIPILAAYLLTVPFLILGTLAAGIGNGLALSILPLFVGIGYAIYVMHLGLPKMMKGVDENPVGYTSVIVVCAFVALVTFGIVSARLSSLFLHF